VGERKTECLGGRNIARLSLASSFTRVDSHSRLSFRTGVGLQPHSCHAQLERVWGDQPGVERTYLART
jgi:hypothetical protein